MLTDQPFIADDRTEELLHDKIARLEAEVQEQCRINGIGAERELALMAKVERFERDLKSANQQIENNCKENAELRNSTLEEAAVKCEEQADRSRTLTGAARADACADRIRSMKS